MITNIIHVSLPLSLPKSTQRGGDSTHSLYGIQLALSSSFTHLLHTPSPSPHWKTSKLTNTKQNVKINPQTYLTKRRWMERMMKTKAKLMLWSSCVWFHQVHRHSASCLLFFFFFSIATFLLPFLLVDLGKRNWVIRFLLTSENLGAKRERNVGNWSGGPQLILHFFWSSIVYHIFKGSFFF